MLRLGLGEEPPTGGGTVGPGLVVAPLTREGEGPMIVEGAQGWPGIKVTIS